MSKKTKHFAFSRESATWSLGDKISKVDCIFVVNNQGRSLKDAKYLQVKESETQCEIIAEFDFPKVNVSLVFELFENKTAIIVQMNITNSGTAPLTIGDSKIFSLNSASELNLGSNSKDMIFFEFHDSLGDNYIQRISDNEGIHNSTQLCHISNSETGKTFFAGNLTFDKMFSQCSLNFNLQTNKIDSLDFTMLFNNYVLKPGKVISSEKIYVEIANDGPYRVLEKWAGMVNDIYQPNIPEQSPVGWIGWSWVDGFKTELPESIAERNSKAIRERLAGFDIKYFWTSISNLKNGLPGNWLVPNDTFYPKGLDKTVEKLKTRGFQPGFWVAPFYQCEGSDTFEGNLDNMHKDENGNQIPRQGWLWAADAKDDALPKLHYLDPSHSDTEKFVSKVFSEYRKKGIKYYMLDFLHAGRLPENAVAHDPNYVTPWEAYRKCMETIREVTGPDTHLLTAVGSSLAHVGTVTASRIGLDYGEGRQLMPRFASYPANYIINGSYGSAGSPNYNAVNNLACWFFAHRNFFLCDSNILTVDKPIPRNEAEISTSLFGISGGPMMLGDDIDTISEERLGMVKKCLPRGNSAPFPASLFSKLDSHDKSHTFVVNVQKEWGNWCVVAIFNLNAESKTFELDAADLRMPKNKQYRIFDFWQESYCGIFKNRSNVEIPANSVAVFRFEELKEHPWILGTDMHVRQGETELVYVTWDETNLTLSGKATRPIGEKGNLYIVTPWNWKSRNLNKNLWVAKSGIDESLIIRKEIQFNSDIENWQIEFDHFNEEEVYWRNRNKKKFSE